MNYTPTRVICSNCGARDQVVVRMVAGVRVVELPTNWKRVGMGRDHRGILYCGECYRGEINKAIRERMP